MMNARDLLQALGVGEFNATQVIPYMFRSPAVTDADMPPVILLVQKLQERLVDMGAAVRVSGELSVATASALRTLVGPNWPRFPWYRIVESVLEAKRQGVRLETMERSAAFAERARTDISLQGHDGLGSLPIPDFPGGFKLVLAGLAGFYLYRRFGRKKAHA